MSEAETDSQDTTSTQVRYEYTNDAIAVGYLLAFLVLTAVGSHGLLDLAALPVYWRVTVVSIAGIAAAWAFGTAAVQAWGEFQKE